MRDRMKLPPWLARRRYALRLKHGLIRLIKARRAKPDPDGAEAGPRAFGNVIVLDQYRALRALAALR